MLLGTAEQVGIEVQFGIEIEEQLILELGSDCASKILSLVVVPAVELPEVALAPVAALAVARTATQLQALQTNRLRLVHLGPSFCPALYPGLEPVG